MSAQARRTGAALRRLWRAETAAAAVEFALVLPIMLLVYVGTMEASALISMDRKVQSVAGALGDLVARADERITTSALNDYFRAAGGMMAPYSAAPLEQMVTQVLVAADGTVTVDWSREFHDGAMSVGTQYPEDSEFTLPQAMIDISLGQAVIVSETSYSYLPLYGIVFDQPVDLHRESFYLPRFGGGIALN